MTGGTVVAPGLVPGGHGGCRFTVDRGVVEFPAGTAGSVVVVGVVAVGGGVVGGGFCARAFAVPVPVPAGTHGIVVGAVGVG